MKYFKKYLLCIFCMLILSCSKEFYSDIKLINISGSLVGFESSELGNPVRIRAIDSKRNAVSNVELVVNITKGDGKIISHSQLTNEEGEFIVAWKLGKELDHELEIKHLKHNEISISVKARTIYQYKQPEHIADGWSTKSLIQDYGHLKRDLIFKAIEKIRSNVYKEIHGLMMVLDGNLVLEEYFSGHNSDGVLVDFDRNTPHEQQSASKSFRSLLTGIAIQEGYIESLETPIYHFFPENTSLTTNGKQDITLEHILTMSSGLSWEEWVAPPNDLTRMYSRPFSEWHEYVLQKKLIYRPGSVFVYNTGASIMLNRIIENASKMTIADFTRKHFMNKTNSVLLANNANLQAKKLPRDMAKLGQIYLDNGKWQNNQIVSQEWVSKSLTEAFAVPKVGARYGFQWWIKEFKTSMKSYKCYYASGNGGQFIMIFKELNLVIVLTGGNFGGGGAEFSILQNHILPAFEN